MEQFATNVKINIEELYKRIIANYCESRTGVNCKYDGDKTIVDYNE
jgi:hypothetical protein